MEFAKDVAEKMKNSAFLSVALCDLCDFSFDDLPALLVQIPYTTKAEVTTSAVGGVTDPGGQAVAVAVRIVAEVLAAALNSLGSGWWTCWVVAEVRADLVKVWAEPVLAPFPDIANAVVEAEAVRFEGVDRARTFETVFAGVLLREVALENVAAEFSASQQRVSPRPDLLFEPSASRTFPFGFRR